MNVLFFGTYDERRHPRVLALREGFELAGCQVHVLNSPLVDTTEERISASRSAVEAARWIIRLLGQWAVLARSARSVPLSPDVVVVGYLGVLDIHVAKLLFRRAQVLLDHLAPLAETSTDRGLSKLVFRLSALLDRAATAKADIVLVDTDEHLAALPDQQRGKGVVVPVAAPTRWFEVQTKRRSGPLRVIFFGTHTPLQGTPVIGAAIARLSDAPIAFTMVGTGQDYEKCRRAALVNTNVKWIDWVEAEDLPSLVSSHDVCLGVFGTGPKASAVVPNKIIQGAAAGCAILTGDNPPVQRAFGRAAVLVPPGDADALAEALRSLASDSTSVLDLRARARAVAMYSFHPGNAVGELLERLGTP